MHRPRLVLASTSPWRRKLLSDAGIACDGVAPRYDESTVVDPEPGQRALGRARGKAEAVREQVGREPWILAADQVVHQDGELFGKPEDARDHLARLVSMRGRRHALVTGWVLSTPDGSDEGIETTHMHVRADLGEPELRAYVACGEGSGCAGGYAAEGRGAFLFERIEGDWFNVIGLPLLSVIGALRSRGWRFDQEAP